MADRQTHDRFGFGIGRLSVALRVAAPSAGDETLPGADVTAPYFATVRDALDHWRRGAAPPISVHDCARVVRLIDQAYERAG